MDLSRSSLDLPRQRRTAKVIPMPVHAGPRTAIETGTKGLNPKAIAIPTKPPITPNRVDDDCAEAFEAALESSPSNLELSSTISVISLMISG
jgi:hypothetical protein